jgi:hypothetical protein
MESRDGQRPSTAPVDNEEPDVFEGIETTPNVADRVSRPSGPRPVSNYLLNVTFNSLMHDATQQRVVRRRLGGANSASVSEMEADEVGGGVGIASHGGNGIDVEVPAVLAAGAEGVEGVGPGEDADPRLDPAAIIVYPDDEAVGAEGGGAGHADGGALAVPPPGVITRGAGPSPGPPARQRLRSRGIRGHFWSYRSDSDEEDHLGHIESFSHPSESDEINGICVADDPDQVSSNFGGDGSDVDQRDDLNPELMEVDRSGGESEVGDEPSPEPPPGMTLATAVEAITVTSTRPRESIYQTLLRRHYRAVRRRLHITASDDSDDNPVEQPGPVIGEADKENVIENEGSARGAP